MIIQYDRGAKIWSLVNTEGQPATGKVLLDPGADGGEPFLIAGNGTILGAIPCEIIGGTPFPMLLPPEIVQAAGSRQPKELIPTIHVDTLTEQVMVEIAPGLELHGKFDHEQVDQYPKWRRMIPAEASPLRSGLVFDPKLVKQLSQAIGLGDNLPVVFGGGDQTTGILIGMQSSFERASFGLIMPVSFDAETTQEYVQNVLDLRDPLLDNPDDIRDESIKEFAEFHKIAERQILSGPMWLGRKSKDHPTTHMLSDVQQVRTAGDTDPWVLYCGKTAQEIEPALMSDPTVSICGNCETKWAKAVKAAEEGNAS